MACLKEPEVIGGTEYDKIDSINRTQSLLFTSAVPRRAGGWERLIDFAAGNQYSWPTTNMTENIK
jgi:hypothetical protein